MELLKLVAHVNLATDEDFELMQVIGFINDAIAKLNIDAGTLYPFVDDTLQIDQYAQEEYTDLPETWIRTLIVPYASGRIKENDSSQFEYLDWYGQYDANLVQFKANYNIPLVYIDPNASVTRGEEDMQFNMMSPTKGW